MKFAAICAAAISLSTSALAQTPFPPGEGRELVAQHCAQCHAPDVVAYAAKSREEWSATVMTMIGMGAAVPEADVPKVIDYLAKNFPSK